MTWSSTSSRCFGRRDILGTGLYADLDEDVVRSLLEEVNRLATGVLADSFEEGDRNPPVFDPATGSVTMPEGFKKSFAAYRDAGWTNLGLPAEMGGPGLPSSVNWALAEMVLGSNPAVWMYSSGPAFAYVLHTIGTEAQKRYAELAIENAVGRHHGAHRAGRRLRRGRGPRQGRTSRTTAPGTSRASSASSPAPSTT